MLFELHKYNYGPRQITAQMSFDPYGVLLELTPRQRAEELASKAPSSFAARHHSQSPLNEADVKAFEEEL